MQCGYSAKYVLDEMEMYEVNAAMKYQYHSYKQGWEQARLVAYIVAQTQSTKRLTIQDIVKFEWEKEQEEDVDTSITKEQIEALKAQAQMYLKTQNNQVEKR